MNIIELSYVEYKSPNNMPTYLIQPFNYYYDLQNIKSFTNKYDIELIQENKKDVVMYSFDGKITNIKVYDAYIDSVTELLQMYPTNQHLVINDTARKFVELPGLRLS